MSVYGNNPPQIAGVSTRMGEGEGTQHCVTLEERPPTPDHVRKFRRSYFQQEPGMRVLHWGAIDDYKDQDPYHKFGNSNVDDSEHVEDVWRQPGGESDYQQTMFKKTEEAYHSTKREPLGKSYNRGHVLPEGVTSGNFAFGVSSSSSESAKNLLYPKNTEDETQFKEQYLKSHGSYEPGEQRRRKYDWGNGKVDPNSFRFGLGGDSTRAFNGRASGVEAALRGEGETEVTCITSKKTEDVKNLGDQLGRSRNLGQGTRAELPADHVFGKCSVRRGSDEWDARACCEGDYSVEEQMPDSDLGKSHTPGFRNITTDGRAFGCPTVRSDIPRVDIGRRSVADNQNYGDDVNAQALLHPNQFSNIGVADEDFVELRARTDIREIFEAIGYELDDEIFDALWRQACAADGGGDRASIHTFRNRMNEYIEARDGGYLDKWRNDA